MLFKSKTATDPGSLALMYPRPASTATATPCASASHASFASKCAHSMEVWLAVD